MMDLFDRALFFALGAIVGFILGYIVASLHEIKEELSEVVDIEHKRDEHGLINRRSFSSMAMVAVVVLTALAALFSQIAVNKAQNTQDQLFKVAACNHEFLGKTIVALNVRTTSTQNRASANVRLQKDQAAFWTLLLKQPPISEKHQREAAQDYLTSLTKFVVVSGKTSQSIENYPYPSNTSFTECLD